MISTKKCVGLRFGRFFHTLIGSPWLPVSPLSHSLPLSVQKTVFQIFFLFFVLVFSCLLSYFVAIFLFAIFLFICLISLSLISLLTYYTSFLSIFLSVIFLCAVRPLISSVRSDSIKLVNFFTKATFCFDVPACMYVHMHWSLLFACSAPAHSDTA
jgi:hypothetical protein